MGEPLHSCSCEQHELRWQGSSPAKQKKMENFKERFDNVIIEKLSIEKSEITATARFTEELGADSLDMVELVMDFEKEFKIAIPDEDTEEIKTVGDAENYILKILNKKEPN